MPCIDSLINYDFHLVDAFVGFIVAVLLTTFSKWLFKKIRYGKLIGSFYHGNDDENHVVIKHIYDKSFLITEYKDKKIQWKGYYERKSKGLLIGIFDYNFEKKSSKLDWGEHQLHLLPDNKTISVSIKSIVPAKDVKPIEWHRK